MSADLSDVPALKDILLCVKRHCDMRYPTVGDWQEKSGWITISVADMNDRNMNLLILIHELVEKVLCDHRGVTEEAVDEWDMAHLYDDDPGMNILSPYYKEHLVASAIEMFLAKELDVDWRTYEDRVEAVFNSVEESLSVDLGLDRTESEKPDLTEPDEPDETEPDEPDETDDPEDFEQEIVSEELDESDAPSFT